MGFGGWLKPRCLHYLSGPFYYQLNYSIHSNNNHNYNKLQPAAQKKNLWCLNSIGCHLYHILFTFSISL